MRRSFFAAALAALLAGPLGAQPLDQNGQTHEWRKPTGKVTLIEFAASWCSPCRRTLPRLEAYAKERPDVRALVVSIDETRAGRDKLVKWLNLTVPVLWDQNREIRTHYRPRAIPTTYVLSPQGDIVYTSVGSEQKDWDDLVRFVEQKLVAPPATVPAGR